VVQTHLKHLQRASRSEFNALRPVNPTP
jgi:hypothetical protein